MKPVIFVDLDGIAANFTKKCVELYNKEFGTTVSFLDAWSTTHNGEIVANGLDHYLDSDHLFRDLDPIEGFPESLSHLQELGDVYIASAPSRNPDSATDKIKWVLERFPSIHRKNIILLKAKHLLRGDVFLEDWPSNIKKIRATNPNSFIGTIAYPYNKKVSKLLNVSAEGVADTKSAWTTIIASVEHWIENFQ